MRSRILWDVERTVYQRCDTRALLDKGDAEKLKFLVRHSVNIVTALLFKLNKAKAVRTYCAAVFLFVMLFGVGTHLFLDSHSHDAAYLGVETHHDDDHHHDECDAMSVCGDEGRDEHNLPNAQDENTHHHVLVSTNLFDFIHDNRITERLSSESATFFARAPRPPVLPPEYS